MKAVFKTKQELIDTYKRDVKDGKVYHQTLGGKRNELKQLAVEGPKHPYGKRMTYMCYTFCYKGSSKVCPVARFNYIWYKGDIPDGLEVDHIDNNTLNNDPSNLQLLTHKQNLQKRPGNGNNQFTKMNSDMDEAEKIMEELPSITDKEDRLGKYCLAVLKLSEAEKLNAMIESNTALLRLVDLQAKLKNLSKVVL